jgi:peptidyl-prolyl cis-trans isomerase B (cyclophilin B)
MPAAPFLASAALALHAMIAATEPSASLTPRTELAKPDGPLIARLAADGACRLVLLDAAANELARAAATSGDLDLAALLPAIRGATGVVRVQAVVDGTPAGAPLVVIPLRSRDTIRTMQDLRPDGKTAYTRIIGWGDRLLDSSNEAHLKEKERWPKSDPQPMSGFRLMADEDVVFETTAGRIRFAMRPEAAPNTARNFVELAKKGFYDGTIVHRIVPADRNGRPFVIQGGDPTGTGDGGPGYDLPLEPSTLAHDFGVLSMARNDWPDSAGSQWFVGLSREATARLDGQYCAFGEAVEGAETILKIAAGEVADPATGRPAKPETVIRAFTQPAPPWSAGRGRPDARVARPSGAPVGGESDR